MLFLIECALGIFIYISQSLISKVIDTTFFMKQGVSRGIFSENYFWHVQLDSGITTPPIQVTIGHKNANAMAHDNFYNIDNTK